MRPDHALLILALLGSGCALPRVMGEGVTHYTLLSGGYRVLSEDFDAQPVVGLELVSREPESGWGYELGGSFAQDEETGPRAERVEFNELALGLRRSWSEPGRSACTYLGLGGALTRVEHTLHAPGSEFDDEGGGVYLHGGVLWSLGALEFDYGTELLAGLDLRGFVGDDYDSIQLALLLGFAR